MCDTPRVFAISDLHLEGADPGKTMDLFSPRWQGHFLRIREDWERRVGEGDVVLIPGDISWAMRLEDAVPDLHRIGALPGHKVLVKGNHDYWWSSITKVREALPKGMYALQNDAVVLGGIAFCGTRGWPAPGSGEDGERDEKLYRRELMRLEMSLGHARALSEDGRVIAICHYPPCTGRGEDTPVTAMLEKYGVSDVAFGHLHGTACCGAFTGVKNGVKYRLTSCDCVDFSLVSIL
ncbi:MAG TPA: metallophosphoesterase [Candidatus Limnocylindria bacterium]|nr:metallophosphoesterase [Candidatus Limnocylindria bacterium]